MRGIAPTNNAIHSNEDELIDEFMKLAFQIGSNKINWKNSAKKNGVTLDVTTDACFASFHQNKKDEAQGLQIIRGETEVTDITPSIFYDWNEGFQDSHIVWEKEFEKTCTESKALAYIDKDHTVAYTSYAPGYFVSPRDFVYIKTRRYYKNYKNYAECGVGFYYDLAPTSKHWIPPRHKHVRASSIGGYVFCRKDKHSPVRLIFVSRLDLAGWIPIWLVNLAIGSKADSVNDLKINMKIVVQREMKKRSKRHKCDDDDSKTNDGDTDNK
eukprot:157252_1